MVREIGFGFLGLWAVNVVNSCSMKSSPVRPYAHAYADAFAYEVSCHSGLRAPAYAHAYADAHAWEVSCEFGPGGSAYAYAPQTINPHRVSFQVYFYLLRSHFGSSMILKPSACFVLSRLLEVIWIRGYEKYLLHYELGDGG